MFNPNRLTLARKRRRLTGQGLARLIGVVPLTISRLEKGKNEPTPETLDAIAKVLKFPKNFFYGPDIDSSPPDAVSFRSLASMTAKERDAALAARDFAYMLSDWVTERFNLPKTDLIDLSSERNPEKAAIYVRQHWALGQQAINNMVKLLESKGVIVFSLSENTKNVDAFSCWRNDTPYIFLNTVKSPEHSRFDAAHELGHLVLHKHGGPHQGKSCESEANAFASAFLMPEADIRSRISYTASISISKLIEAKKKWGVSVAALVYRLHKIGLLNEYRFRDLCIQISKFGYKRKEPDSMPREESVVWKKVFTELWSEGITKNHIADYLDLSFEEVENLVFGLNGLSDNLNSVKEKGNLRIIS